MTISSVNSVDDSLYEYATVTTQRKTHYDAPAGAGWVEYDFERTDFTDIIKFRRLKPDMTQTTNPAYPTFIPYYDRLLLRRVVDGTPGAPATHPTFNFAMTEAQKEKPQLYEVVAVGGGHLTEMGHVVALQSLPGDRVLVGKYAGAGAEIKLDGEEYITVRENEVLGRVSRAQTPAEFDAAYVALDGSFTIEPAAIVAVTQLPDDIPGAMVSPA